MHWRLRIRSKSSCVRAVRGIDLSERSVAQVPAPNRSRLMDSTSRLGDRFLLLGLGDRPLRAKRRLDFGVAPAIPFADVVKPAARRRTPDQLISNDAGVAVPRDVRLCG